MIAESGLWLRSAIVLCIWVALAFWPTRVAGRKGHSFFGCWKPRWPSRVLVASGSMERQGRGRGRHQQYIASTGSSSEDLRG